MKKVAIFTLIIIAIAGVLAGWRDAAITATAARKAEDRQDRLEKAFQVEIKNAFQQGNQAEVNRLCAILAEAKKQVEREETAAAEKKKLF